MWSQIQLPAGIMLIDYRIVVERHWKALLAKIIEAAGEVRVPEAALQHLRDAETERSVARSLELA